MWKQNFELHSFQKGRAKCKHFSLLHNKIDQGSAYHGPFANSCPVLALEKKEEEEKKVLLECSQGDCFFCCLRLHLNQREELICDRDRMTPMPKNIYYLALYRESLPHQ
jgi:hypothetical protein